MILASTKRITGGVDPHCDPRKIKLDQLSQKNGCCCRIFIRGPNLNLPRGMINMLDMIIRQARTLNEEIFDIGIQQGKICQIAKRSKNPHKRWTLLPNQYLSAGWIDDHVHCFEEMSLYYDYPDQIGVAKGVTTVIDAGTTGAENSHRFYEFAQAAKTNVFALVNISKWGIVEQDELADLSKIKGI